jgi:hypothetical protein
MILGCYMLAADMDETWRLWHIIEAPGFRPWLAGSMTTT